MNLGVKEIFAQPHGFLKVFLALRGGAARGDGQCIRESTGARKVVIINSLHNKDHITKET
jgi:hypothetical protein